VTAGLGVLFLAILFSGSIRSFFSPRTTVTAVFTDVKGLRPGAPVWFAGVQVGSVRSLKFEQGRIVTTLSIDLSALPYLKKDSAARIMTMGLMGDKYVELAPGTRDAAPLEAGAEIGGASPPEIAEELQRFVSGVEGGKGSLAMLLRDESLYRDLAVSARDIKAFAAMLRSSEGTLAKTIRDPAVYDRFQKASASLEAFSDRLVSSRGTLQRLVDDASLYENMNRAAERMNKILERVESGQGSLGTLVKDREVAEEIRLTLKELKGLAKDMREHPKRYFDISVF
jgi:phospholipid/cholesterol/gamma-HCH transport system substrate-binding protein